MTAVWDEAAAGGVRDDAGALPAPPSPSAPAARGHRAPGGHDPFAVDAEDALRVLEAEWGFAYTLIYRDGLFCAQRKGPSGQPAGPPLSGETPDEISRELRRDWGECP